jgi:hypothetical protein
VPVFGIVKRGGKAKTFHTPAVNLRDNVSIEADLLCTDESSPYIRTPKNIQKHGIVNHSAKEIPVEQPGS